MSRSIDFSKPLSPEDHEYAQQRPWLIRDAELEGYEVRVAGDFDAEADEDEEGEDVAPYSEWKKGELVTEVERRNADREPDDQIVVEAPGNIAQLVAALEQDDETADEE